MRLEEGLYPSFETGPTSILPSQSSLGGMILHPSSRRRTEPAALTLRLIMLMLRSVRAAYTPASGSTGCSSDAVIPRTPQFRAKKEIIITRGRFDHPFDTVRTFEKSRQDRQLVTCDADVMTMHRF